MKKKLLMSLILLQGCNMHHIQEVNPVAEQLVEPPELRAKNVNPDVSIQEWQRKQNQLSQNQWQLVRYFTEQGMQAVLPKQLASIEFSAYRVSGSTGCNRYFASYQLMGEDSLTISKAGSTMMACPGPIATQEQQYLKNLPKVSFFQIQHETLQLLDALRQVRLEYKISPPLSLEKIDWQMIGINNGTGGVVSSAHTGQANLQFIDGKLQGSGGCNALNASYQVQDSELIIGPVSITRKICLKDDLMTQEKQLLQALTKVRRYKIRSNQLHLIDADGSLMLKLKQE